MTLRRDDGLFLLARAPHAVEVVGDDRWSHDLAGGAFDVSTAVGEPDVVAGRPRRRHLRAPVLATVAERGGPRLPRGWHRRAYLRLPVDDPVLAVPTTPGRALRYALRTWSPAPSTRKQVRNLVVRHVAPRLPVGRLLPSITVAQPVDGPPFLVAGAAELLDAPVEDWLLLVAGTDRLSRGVLLLFAAEERPRWALKFGRVRGLVDPFDRDEAGLRAVAAAGPVTRGRAPRLHGRREIDGFHLSVESAAVGPRFDLVLRGVGRSTQLAMIERVAEWILASNRETAKRPDGLAVERRRLTDLVLPRFRDRGVPGDLALRVPPVPGVLAHHDLGTWNLVADDSDFTVVDWESSCVDAMPLWDLAYFLADALGVARGLTAPEERAAHTIRLFRGELPESDVLFRWLRRASKDLGVPPEAVGPVVTLAWLHHGGTHVDRDEQHHRLGVTRREWLPAAALVAARWLDDPLLGWTWSPQLGG